MKPHALLTLVCLTPLLFGCGEASSSRNESSLSPETSGSSLSPSKSESVAPSSENSSESENETELSFKDYNAKNTKFNNDLFYRNDLELDMGDPMMVYDEETGYFYASGTRGTTTFHCLRSKNLANWERMDDMFVPESSSWSRENLWAPDIQHINGKWYLYYTGKFENNGGSNCQIGVAVSDKPYGPYKQVKGPDGTLKTTPFMMRESEKKYCTVLDQTVFQDDNGDLYMYFSYDMRKSRKQDYAGYNVQEIWGVKMTSPTSWDLSTLKRLASPGLARLSDKNRTVEWETWSTSFSGDMECLEGPYMIKKNGKYFLTYVGNSYVDTVYNVGYAVSDSPLGDFVKPNSKPLENMLLGVPGNDGTYVNTRYLGFMTGTGHASICKIGDEYMFAYHAHRNRNVWGYNDDEWRCLGYDYLYFDANGVPYTNGPTYSINRLPNKITGYHNLSLDNGTVFSSEGKLTGLDYLHDNFTFRGQTNYERADQDVRKEADFEGKVDVKVKLEAKKKVKFILVNNSYSFDYKLDFIDKIGFGEGRVVKNVLFNQGYYRTKPNKWIFPHSDFVIELTEEVETDEITFTFDSNKPYSLGEIEIYGK